jgi:hypothetical protein
MQVSHGSALSAPREAACNRKVFVTIKAEGGAFRVPPCSAWTGTIAYPSVNARARFAVTSSVTNSFGAPTPPSGTAVFYLQTRTKRSPGTPAFRDTGVTDTVSGPAFTSGHTYTLIVYNFAEDAQCPSPPPSQVCPPWIANIGSPSPNTNSITFPSPLNGALFGDEVPVWQFVQD